MQLKEHFSEIYISDRSLNETFVNDSAIKEYLKYIIPEDYKGNRFSINANELIKLPGQLIYPFRNKIVELSCNDT
jgi:hypothetical protein